MEFLLDKLMGGVAQVIMYVGWGLMGAAMAWRKVSKVEDFHDLESARRRCSIMGREMLYAAIALLIFGTAIAIIAGLKNAEALKAF